MARKRDGDVVATGTISGKDQERALLGRIRRKRASGDERERELGYAKLEVDTEGLEADLLRPNVGPRSNDGVTIEGHATHPGEPLQPGRVNRLTEARLSAQLSVEEVAAEAALPAKLVERYEGAQYTDAYYVPDAHRAALAIALNLAEDDLFPRRVAGQGLPSLIPAPAPARTGRQVSQADLGEQHEQQAAVALAEFRDARSAEELEKAGTKLREIQRGMEKIELTDRADELGRRINQLGG
jgi:transcriptional regulator with XRE-family HTH domain